MRNTLKTITIFLFLIVSIANSAVIEGFRDLKWEDDVSKLGKSTISDKQSDKTIIYKKEKEHLMVGETKLKFINYYFFDNKFSAVLMAFSSKEAMINIKKSFEAKYQDAQFFQIDIDKERYEMFGDNGIIISIECDKNYSKCFSWVTNAKLFLESGKYDDEFNKKILDKNAKKGAKDL